MEYSDEKRLSIVGIHNILYCNIVYSVASVCGIMIGIIGRVYIECIREWEVRFDILILSF